jgi:iron complex outermembrane receptor protein
MIGRSIILASASVLAMFASVDQAKSQESAQTDTTAAPNAEEEIVVTARKREEALVDVPSAIAVIDAATLENRGGAATALDLLTGQPGVRVFDTGSPALTELSIRGSSTARGTNADPSVGMYRNGAYIGGGRLGGRTFTGLDLFDIGRVEVLRGSQGALYGRNAVGGAINVISQQPLFETGGYLNYRLGLEPESNQVEVVANFALNDVFAVRFGGQYVDKDEGFFYNPTNDVYFDRENGSAFRAQARMRTNALDITLLLEHQQTYLPATNYQVYIPPTLPRFPSGYIQDQFVYPWNAEPFTKQQLNDALLTVNYDMGWATLVSTTFYRDRKTALSADLDALDGPTSADLVARGIIVLAPGAFFDFNVHTFQNDDTETLTEDIHLEGEAVGGRLDWLLGGEYLYQTSDSVIVNTRTPTGANPSPGTRSPFSTEYESWAVYGSLGYDLTESLNLTGEARYTSDTRSAIGRRFDLATGAPSGGNAFIVNGASAPENISYNVTASYDFGALLAYAKLGTSYRAGGFNINLGDPRQPIPIPATYDDETSTVYEIGVKGDLSDNVYLALAGYASESENLIVQRNNGCNASNPACPIVATPFLTNAGGGEIWGVEAELSYRAEILGGRMRATVGGSRQEGEAVSGPFAGLELPQIPDWIASAELYYTHPFVAGTEVFGNFQYNGQWGGVQELIATSTPVEDRQLFNLRGGVRIPNEWGSLELSAFVNNATDEVFTIFDGGTTRRISQRRTYGVAARLRW